MIPLRELLNMRVFTHVKIITGEQNLNNPVSGVTVMEAPDIVQWLRGGELILTSLYPISHDRTAQRNLVKNLVEKGASGLAIKTQRFFESIPTQIIHDGDKYGLPIIELPGDLRYVDIINPIMSEIINKQVNRLNHFKEVHDQLTDLAVKGESLSTIINTLATIISNPVLLLDGNFQLRISSHELLQEEPEILEEQRIKTNCYRQVFKAPSHFNQEMTRILVPIRIENQIQSHLCVIEQNHKLKEHDFISLEHATTVLSLEMAKQSAVSEILKRFKNELLNDLLIGRIDTEKYYYEQAQLMGWNLNQAFRVVIFKINNIESAITHQKKKGRLDAPQLTDEIYTVAHKTIHEYVAGSIMGSKANSLVCLWPDKTTDEKNKERVMEQIKEASKLIQKRIKEKFPRIIITIGFGTIAKSIDQIQQSYQEAWNAINFGQMIHGEEAVIGYRELGVYRILCQFVETYSPEKYIPQSIKTLLEYDKKHETEMIHTLEVFLNSNGNASKAAKDLFIHYKTMLYRLDRIKKITQLDLENPEKRLEIEIGLRLLHLLRQTQKIAPPHSSSL